MLPDERRLYGKYRGFVAANDDPRRAGRLKVRVPALFGSAVLPAWAWPCFPAGTAPPDLATWQPPAVGAKVWVEFEQGDPDHPIWVGFWG